MKKRVAGILVAVVISLATSQAVPPNEDRYSPTPWHLVDVWCDIGKDVVIDTCSVDLDISDDIASEEARFFVVPFCGTINGQQFYTGIITDAVGNTLKDPQPRSVGRGGVFSRWGERGHDNVRPAVGGCFLDSDIEGDFVSVRTAHKWKKGKYTLKIVKMETEKTREGSYVWAGAYLYSHERDETLFFGALRFKGENLQLSQKVCMFVEVYERPIPIREIPSVVVKFSNLRVNDGIVENPKFWANYPPKVPDCADAQQGDGVITVTVKPVETKRAERLIELPNRPRIVAQESQRAELKVAGITEGNVSGDEHLATPKDKSTRESRKVDKPFFDSYFVVGGALLALDRCDVAFWNLSGQPLTLIVEGKSRTLSHGANLRMDLKREFTWQVEGLPEECHNVPASESGVEIVIRR